MSTHKNSKLILPSQDVALERTTEIDRICDPLKGFDITFFNYLKVYRDGSIVDVNNAPVMHEAFYYSTTLFQDFDPISSTNQFQNGFILFQCEEDNFYAKMKEQFSIDNILAYIVNKNDFTEYWQYGTQPNKKHIVNFYLNNTSLLKSFTQYFSKEAGKIIIQAEKFKYKITTNNESNTISSHYPYNQDEVETLLIKFSSENSNFKYLTTREIQILKYFINSMSAKEIAHALKISFRTVQKHVENIKEKLGYKKISSLISKVNLGQM